MTTTIPDGRTLGALAEEMGAWATQLLLRLDELGRVVHTDQERLARALSGRVFDAAVTGRVTQQLRLIRCGTPGGNDELLATLHSVGARHAGRRPLISPAADARSIASLALESLSTPRTKSLFSSRASSGSRAQAVVSLAQLRDWAERTGFEAALGHVPAESSSAPNLLAHGLHCISDSLGVVAPDNVEILAAADAVTLSGAWEAGRNLASSFDSLRDNVRTSFEGVQQHMVNRQLDGCDIEILRSLVPPSARLQAVRDAGANTVADLVALGNPAALHSARAAVDDEPPRRGR